MLFHQAWSTVRRAREPQVDVGYERLNALDYVMILNELTCKTLVELITEYLEGALAPAERARFEAHLAGCHGCSIYLEQMRQTIRMLGRLTEDSLSTDAQEELLQLFRNWKPASSLPNDSFVPDTESCPQDI